MMSKLSPQLQAGFTLIESLLVGVIIAAIVVAVLFYHRTAQESLRTTRAVSSIRNIVEQSYRWAEGQHDFSTISLTALVDAELLPQQYSACVSQQKGCDIVPQCQANPWHGSIIVGSEKSTTTGQADRMYVQFCNVPEKVCTSLEDKMRQYAQSTECKAEQNSKVQYFRAVF